MIGDAGKPKGRSQADLLEEQIARLEKRNPRALILSLHRTQLDRLRRAPEGGAGEALTEPVLVGGSQAQIPAENLPPPFPGNA